MRRPGGMGSIPASGAVAASRAKSEVRVVTFDLDNTVWKTGATLSDANDALVKHLEEKFGIKEKLDMGRLFKQCPERYAGVDYSGGGNLVAGSNPTNSAKSNKDGDGTGVQESFDNKQGGKAKKRPVYLTLLRKDAIRSSIREAAGAAPLSETELEGEVDAAFEAWMGARCESISRNLAPSAAQTLKKLKSREGLYVGAITDGNSDPGRVPELSGVFDFVIRAEEVGVAKPDRRVYMAAVAALLSRLAEDGRSAAEFFLGKQLVDEGAATDTVLKSYESNTALDWKVADRAAVEAFSREVGPWWVHVGDDVPKDVVAAREFGARAVWARELIGGGGEPGEKRPGALSDTVWKSDGDSPHGSRHVELGDAVLDRFGDLPGLLAGWHEEGRSARAQL